jgi:hypothetical protein
MNFDRRRAKPKLKGRLEAVRSCAVLQHLAVEKNEDRTGKPAGDKENRRPGPALEQEDANQIDNEKQEPAIGPSFGSSS